MIWLLAHLLRRPAPHIDGLAIQRAEHERAKARILDLARQRRAAHLYDGPTR